MSLHHPHKIMNELERAVKKLEGNPDFEFIMGLFTEYKNSQVDDLSNLKNAENPQLLAYLAGGISTLNMFLGQINECRSKEADK